MEPTVHFTRSNSSNVDRLTLNLRRVSFEIESGPIMGIPKCQREICLSVGIGPRMFYFSFLIGFTSGSIRRDNSRDLVK